MDADTNTLKIFQSLNAKFFDRIKQKKDRKIHDLTTTPTLDGFAAGPINDSNNQPDKPFDPEVAISKMLENATYKAQQDGSVLYMINDHPAFVDYGQYILMAPQANEDEKAILAAILLAKQKYGGAFELTGSEAFKRRAIEVMLKHKINARLKDPQQDALRRELEKTNTKSFIDPPAEAASQKRDHDIADTKIAAEDGVDHFSGRLLEHGRAHYNHDPEENMNYFAKLATKTGEKIIWGIDLERAIANSNTQVGDEITLKYQGKQPVTVETLKRDKSGKVTGRELIETYRNTWEIHKPDTDHQGLRARDAISSTESRAELISDINLKELNMAFKQEENNQQQAPKPVLRGARKLDNGDFDTTVLLFKGKGDYLQGFVKVGDQKHQVFAYLNERKPDPQTGETRPNFIKLSEPHGDGDDATWREIGFGNAVNQRKDGKPVYFDEVLFSVGDEVVKAKTTKYIDDDLHRKLGFKEPQQARPKYESKNDSAPGDVSPKLIAPTAKEDAVGAPKIRHSSRARA